eukprot:TRINITY_DN12294_c0_g1_i3.p1 TRINITY_DN12294_c0_g1~~TRINITY_DN12294_c0_g1_i3.p1  ORF type:complete len:463 (-),score=72.63 TRINITY_DN12294_c0_g1_i3:94-1482(-)
MCIRDRSTLFLNVGQCGSQLGVAVLAQLRAQHHSENDFSVGYQSGKTHAVFIDTEPKVVKPLLDDRKMYPFIDPKSILFSQNGRGNNWALGYHDLKSSEHRLASIPEVAELQNFKENTSLIERSLETIRREIESMDTFMATLMTHSLAGGTGSGFGSRLLEELRDEYAKVFMASAAVFPLSGGETTLQHYNTLLATSACQRHADVIIHFHNEKISRVLGRQSTSLEKVVNFNNVNEYIASQLVSLIKVNDLQKYDRMYPDLLIENTPLDECKFLELFAVPYQQTGKPILGPETSWETLIDRLSGLVNVEPDEEHAARLKALAAGNAKAFLPRESAHASLSLKCIMRSADVEKSFSSSEILTNYLDKKLRQHFVPVSWNEESVSVDCVAEKCSPGLDSKSISVISNRVFIADVLQETQSVARTKYKVKAYLHWYYKHGVTPDDFDDAFEVVDTIIDNYHTLVE